MATTTTTTVCGVRARPLAPPPVQVPPLPTTVGPLVPLQYVPPPGVPLVTPTNAGGARAMPLPLVAPAAPLYMLPLKSIPGQPWYAPLQQKYGPGWTPTDPNPTPTWLFAEAGDACPARAALQSSPRAAAPCPPPRRRRRRPASATK